MTTNGSRTSARRSSESEELRARLRTHPLDAAIRTQLARLYWQRGDDPSANRLLRQAIYDDPAHCAAHELLARIYGERTPKGAAPDLYKAWAIGEFTRQARSSAAAGDGALAAPTAGTDELGTGATLVNAGLDLSLLRSAFRADERVRVANFLLPQAAERLYRDLAQKVGWQTFVIANEREWATPARGKEPLDAKDERELAEFAYAGARCGFAALFDADRPLLAESATVGQAPTAGQQLRSAIDEFIHSAHFLASLRRLTGILELARVESQAMCLRPGHFISFRCGGRAAPAAPRPSLRYELHLTPAWQPEWGGMLEVTNDIGNIEALPPCFNTLDLLSLPRGHWISPIAPFADGVRYSVAGFVYCD